jgi:hypothetical protein
MSVSLGAEAHASVLPVGVNEVRGLSRPARGRSEGNDQPASVELASRDVMDEVRYRMAQQGRRWD